MSKKGENIYKRKDGRWEGRVKFFDSINGKSKYKSVYGSGVDTGTHCIMDDLESAKKAYEKGILAGESLQLSDTEITLNVGDLYDIQLKMIPKQYKFDNDVFVKVSDSSLIETKNCTSIDKIFPYFKTTDADISCTVSLHTSLFANGTRKVAFAGAGEPIKYDWLVLFDETAVPECQDQIPVKPSLFIVGNALYGDA